MTALLRTATPSEPNLLLGGGVFDPFDIPFLPFPGRAGEVVASDGHRSNEGDLKCPTKGLEGSVKMSVEYVSEARGMAEVILQKVHRGPGDTIDAAMHRAERTYGVPAAWLHRLRYREITDMPVSVFGAIVHAYRAAVEASGRAYEAERKLADARGSKLLGLADALAGTKAREE